MGKRKKKKQRDPDRVGDAGLAASQRVARAVDVGLQAWSEARERSSRRARDGAAGDFVRNAVFATTRGLHEGTWVTPELWRAFSKRNDPRRAFIRGLLPWR